MKFTDKNIHLHGILSLKRIDALVTLPEALELSRKNQEAFGFVYKGKNVITLDGLRATSRAISTGGVYIRGLAFGTGGADTDDLLSPIPPSITDTELANESFRVTLDTSAIIYDDTTPVSVTFSVLAKAVDYADLGIEYINEAGLVLHTSKEEELDLYSRITFPSIPFASLASPATSALAQYTIFVDANSASLFNNT